MMERCIGVGIHSFNGSGHNASQPLGLIALWKESGLIKHVINLYCYCKCGPLKKKTAVKFSGCGYVIFGVVRCKFNPQPYTQG